MAEAQGTRVLLRVRPFNQREREESRGGTARCLEVQPDATSLCYMGSDAPANSTFFFDRVLGEEATQQDAFEEVVDVVRAVLDGFNGTILAFGQTGSGKTHTLLGEIGNAQHRGLVPRAVAELARLIGANAEPGVAFKVTLSVVEIYCERIKDLLNPEKDNLQVMQDRDRGIFVADATELPVRSEAECVKLMQEGIANRAVSATAMNAGSSRSHCVVTLVVEKAFPDGGVAASKLCLVDLAGSERQDKTGASGQTLTEGSLINKSLSTLSNVIAALTDPRAGGGRGHVPYRDSKLTRVLQDSLGGSARTALIICCSPSLFNDAETLSSLRFGSRARGMQNSVQAASVRRSPEQLAKILAAAQAECAALKQQLAQGGGVRGDGSLAAGAGAAAAQAVGSGRSLLATAALTAAVQAVGVLLYFAADAYLLAC